MSAPYDSTLDTLRHSRRVDELLSQVIAALQERLHQHDESKMHPPELEIFNEFTPKLKTSTYGSEEYRGFLDAMGDGLAHHYENNRHHPEHFANGVRDMNIVDVIEMLCDWKAATERHDDGDLGKSIQIQRNRFHLDNVNMLTDVLRNTAREMGWL